MSPALPVLRPKEVVRALERAGFYVDHQRGSHARLKHREHPERNVTVPMSVRELKRKTLATILKQAAMTVEDLQRLL